MVYGLRLDDDFEVGFDEGSETRDDNLLGWMWWSGEAVDGVRLLTSGNDADAISFLVAAPSIQRAHEHSPLCVDVEQLGTTVEQLGWEVHLRAFSQKHPDLPRHDPNPRWWLFTWR